MNLLTDRRIALIGGAGFVGHHLALELKRLGAEVFVIDSLGVNNYDSLKQQRPLEPRATRYLAFVRQRLDLLAGAGIPLCKIDARDYQAVCGVLTRIDVDSVVHLAAVSHAGRSNKDPYSTFDHSLRTLENALDNARSDKLRIGRFVYLSSSMVYGQFGGRAVAEDAVCEPLGIYGALKFAGEKLVIAYHQVFGQEYTIIRPSALYGPRCISRRVGQVFIEAALDGRTVPIHGDGSSQLDFTYVADLIQGLVQVLVDDRARNQIFNMTFGQGRSINELVAVLRTWFPALTVVHHPTDHLTPERGTLNIAKAVSQLGYRPSYSLEQGLAEYVGWYRGRRDAAPPSEAVGNRHAV